MGTVTRRVGVDHPFCMARSNIPHECCCQTGDRVIFITHKVLDLLVIPFKHHHPEPFEHTEEARCFCVVQRAMCGRRNTVNWGNTCKQEWVRTVREKCVREGKLASDGKGESKVWV